MLTRFESASATVIYLKLHCNKGSSIFATRVGGLFFHATVTAAPVRFLTSPFYQHICTYRTQEERCSIHQSKQETGIGSKARIVDAQDNENSWTGNETDEERKHKTRLFVTNFW